jgi:hypothetical protein
MTEPQRIAWYDNPLIYQRLWSDDADLQTYAEFVAANHAEIFLMRQQKKDQANDQTLRRFP